VRPGFLWSAGEESEAGDRGLDPYVTDTADFWRAATSTIRPMRVASRVSATFATVLAAGADDSCARSDKTCGTMPHVIFINPHQVRQSGPRAASRREQPRCGLRATTSATPTRCRHDRGPPAFSTWPSRRTRADGVVGQRRRKRRFDLRVDLRPSQARRSCAWSTRDYILPAATELNYATYARHRGKIRME